MQTILKNNQGMALVTAIMMMVILLSITGAALLFSGLNLRASSNLKTGRGAIHAADAGIQHGFVLLPKGYDFNSLLAGSVSGFPCASPCNGTQNQPTLTGSLSGSGYTYSVVAVNDGAAGEGPTSDINRIVILTSTATGPNGSKRKIQAYIGRKGSSAINFTVTGNDTNYDGTAGSAATLPGMTSLDSSVITSIINALSSAAQKARVTGVGAAPSVQTTTQNDDVNTIGQNFINQITATTCPPKCLNGLQWETTQCPASTPCTLGTDAAPQITYLKEGTADVKLKGYINGSGVLVVEGEAELGGNLNFHGLVIHIKAPPTSSLKMEMELKDSAQIYGGVLLGRNNDEMEFDMKGSAAIRYSSQAITMVRNYWASCCLPSASWVPASAVYIPGSSTSKFDFGNQDAKIIGWKEVMQ